MSTSQRGGNRIRLLENGKACLPAIFEAMRARREVFIGFEGYGRGPEALTVERGL